MTDSITSREATEAARFMLVIDCSSSMKGNKLVQAQEGADAFAVKALRDGHLVGIISFAQTPVLLQLPAADHQLILRAISDLRPAGGTDIAAAFFLATRTLGQGDRRTIVLVTDGMPWPNTPETRERTVDMADDAKLLGIEIMCIGTDDADLEFLRQLASLDELAKHVSSMNLRQELEASYDLMKLLGP